MSNIIAQCNYDSFPRNTSHNQIIQNNIGLIGQNDDICVDLQTLYNTIINKDNDMGSTYKYTITPYTSDIQNSKKKHHHREHFITDDYNKNISYDYLGLFVLFFVIILLMHKLLC